jgi:alpha-L-fucosidase 2
MKTTTCLALTVTLACLAAAHSAELAADMAQRVSRYDVIWNTPSKDASGMMPIGNGDIAAGVYAIGDGDLYLLLSKNDAYTYQGDLFKTGRVRISLDPNPFRRGKPFRQTLDLSTGSIFVEADGVKLRIWADAHRSVCHVEITAPDEIAISARPEFWRRFDHCAANQSSYTPGVARNGIEPTQDVCLKRNGRILWYFAVGDRSIYTDDLKAYEVEGMASRFADPFRFNTFGNLLACPTLILRSGALAGKGKTFDIRIHGLTMQTPKPETWIEEIQRKAQMPVEVAEDWQAHCAWWAAFWKRGWIMATDRTLPPESRERFSGEPTTDGVREEEDAAALVTQNYNVFRYLMACQSRGRVQVKFNGGLFTQPLRLGTSTPGKSPRDYSIEQRDGNWLTHEDDRLWGRRFTYQNQRLLYWPLLASGDFDLMKPFFDYYVNLLPMRQAISKAWFGHEGAYYRENIEPTGGERDCDKGLRPPKSKPGEKYEGWYHAYYFTSGLETTAMMLDYVRYTGDTAFRDRALAPFAREILLFYDLHYPREANGKIRLEPAQTLETWWVAINPTPDIAGLRFCLDGLLEMKVGTPEDQTRWRRFRREIPEVFLRAVEGHEAIAPATKWDRMSNCENGEMYAAFPFRCFGIAQGTGGVVDWTMKHRSVKDAFGCACWTQDQIGWACAGNAAQAADGLVRRFRIASPMCRFPMYGREGPDSCPDFDHFGSGSVALQRMLVQEAGNKILLLPAWPADWDVDFKLHLAHNTVLKGQIREGKLTAWDIQPESRRKDVTVCKPQIGKVLLGVVPANDHPLRVGADQNGQNKFVGQIGRISMFRGKLSPQTIKELAAGDWTKAVAGSDLVGCWLNPRVGDTLPTKAEDFSGAVSFETWVRPSEKESGRILDKITAGMNDGFLWDAWPNCSLRLIAGSQRKDVKDGLKAGVWQHIAVIISRGSPRLYVNGQPAE